MELLADDWDYKCLQVDSRHLKFKDLIFQYICWYKRFAPVVMVEAFI